MVASLTGRTTLAEHARDGVDTALAGLLDAFTSATAAVAAALGRGALTSAPEFDAVRDEAATASGATRHLRRGGYSLVVDPLDGADAAGAGTLFSVLRGPDHDVPAVDAVQVCAGVVHHGPATVLFLTTGDGVDGFTLDPDTGAFLLTHPRIRIPESTGELGVDAAGERFWEAPVRRYVAECLAGTTGPRGRDFTVRWEASLVADVYRVLTRGGVVLRPSTRDADRPLVTAQCRPVAFLVEQAGGLASTGRSRVLDLTPSGRHQRAPLVFGAREEVERVELHHRAPAWPAGADFSLFNVRSLFRG